MLIEGFPWDCHYASFFKVRCELFTTARWISWRERREKSDDRSGMRKIFSRVSYSGMKFVWRRKKEKGKGPSLLQDGTIFPFTTYFSRNSMHEILSYLAPILTLKQTENTISMYKTFLRKLRILPFFSKLVLQGSKTKILFRGCSKTTSHWQMGGG